MYHGGRGSKVDDLAPELGVYDDVLVLDVPVHDAQSVEVQDARDDLKRIKIMCSVHDVRLAKIES